MLIAMWPIVFALVGVVLAGLASNAKLVNIGLITFFVGIFWLVYGLAGKTLHLG